PFPICATPPPPYTYPLSLHDALPIYGGGSDGLLGQNIQRVSRNIQGLDGPGQHPLGHHRSVDHIGTVQWEKPARGYFTDLVAGPDRKSTRLNSSHVSISYAVFCLKKK